MKNLFFFSLLLIVAAFCYMNYSNNESTVVENGVASSDLIHTEECDLTMSSIRKIDKSRVVIKNSSFFCKDTYVYLSCESEVDIKVEDLCSKHFQVDSVNHTLTLETSPEIDILSCECKIMNIDDIPKCADKNTISEELSKTSANFKELISDPNTYGSLISGRILELKGSSNGYIFQINTISDDIKN